MCTALSRPVAHTDTDTQTHTHTHTAPSQRWEPATHGAATHYPAPRACKHIYTDMVHALHDMCARHVCTTCVHCTTVRRTLCAITLKQIVRSLQV